MKITTWPIDQIHGGKITRVGEELTYALALKEVRKQEKEAENKPGKHTFTIMRIEN